MKGAEEEYNRGKFAPDLRVAHIIVADLDVNKLNYDKC
jgi:hypothetical protein